MWTYLSAFTAAIQKDVIRTAGENRYILRRYRFRAIICTRFGNGQHIIPRQYSHIFLFIFQASAASAAFFSRFRTRRCKRVALLIEPP